MRTTDNPSPPARLSFARPLFVHSSLRNGVACSLSYALPRCALFRVLVTFEGEGRGGGAQSETLTSIAQSLTNTIRWAQTYSHEKASAAKRMMKNEG